MRIRYLDDIYTGEPEEVIRKLKNSGHTYQEGLHEYMQGVRRRVRQLQDIDIPTSGYREFLKALEDAGEILVLEE